MKTILTIVKKEFARVLKDWKLVLMIFIFPGLMIFAMYSVIGSSIANITEGESEYPVRVYSSNIPEEIKGHLSSEAISFNGEYYEIEDLELHKEALLQGGLDFIIVFPANFVNDIENNIQPTVEYYFNPTNDASQRAYDAFSLALSIYESEKVADKFGDISIFTRSVVPIFSEEKTIALLMSMLLPFLIITFLFQGAMSLGPESIAGEKERGTIASLLITPTKRGDIALGKILSLSALASLSALSSFIGIILSIPKLIGLSDNPNIYGFGEYALVFIILIVTVLVIIGLVSILSAFAKTVKEASLIVLPLYLVIMGVGLMSMLSTSAVSSNMYYLIPIYNSLQMLRQIFSFEINYLNFATMLISNITLALILSFALTQIFKSEKIMFAK